MGWKTINGARVFIEEGQSIADAFKSDREVKSLMGTSKDDSPTKKKTTLSSNAKWTPDESMLQFEYEDDNGRKRHDFLDFRDEVVETLKIREGGKVWEFQEFGKTRVLEFDQPVSLPKSLDKLGQMQKKYQAEEEGAMRRNLKHKGGS